MKNLLCLLLLAITGLAYSQNKNEFSLHGKTKDIPDGTVFLVGDFLQDKIIDSVKVMNNSFILKTRLPDYPYSIYLLRDSSTSKTVWAENTKMTFDATKSAFEDAVITGSATDALAIQLRDKQRVLKSYEEKVALEVEFIKNNPNSILSAHNLSIMASVFGREKSAALFEKFSAKNKQSQYGEKIKAFLSLDIPETPKTGEKYVDFTMADQNGIAHKLSEFEGKVILLEFWASWCVPCRKANPELIKTYDRFKNLGFEIVAVSLDEKKEHWSDAIKKDGLPWKHLSDLKGRNNLAALTYSVNSIPDNVLIDKNGVILASSVRNNERLNTLLADALASTGKRTQTADIKIKTPMVWQDENGKVLSREEGQRMMESNQYTPHVDTEKNIMVLKKAR
ncbi:redoxin domain-containing protein [Flavobacterium sp. Sd200]|uniref:AhpC/TSA family protein n=1 Tax=Flavobacterium sp. Sd200 TaxID=2692211 RepID=UPI0013698E30|nr:AhpC/TSA family protein [Flavobacterium sp. Sd200]MXN92071.1 redoxin domain-containing protein [Flavobacterium sp. Sd200]